MKNTRLLFQGLVWLAAVPVLAAPSPAGEEADGVMQMVIRLLADADKDVRALGLEQVRSELKGRASTEAFAALLPKLPEDAQAGLVGALAERGDKAARPAVLALLAASRDVPVRLAAIGALVHLGEPADAQVLIRLLSEGPPDEQAAARSSLGRMPGAPVSAVIAEAIGGATAPLRVTLIEILGQRRAAETVARILPLAVEADPRVRAAAIDSLGKLAGPEHIPAMVQVVLQAEEGRQREAAEKAVMFACGRIADPQKQAEPLLAAIEGLSPADRAAILPTLGRVGGEAALPSVEAAIASRDPAAHEAGVRALCNWPDASVAARLIELAQADGDPEHRTALLRALVRIAPLPDGRTDAERLALLQKAMALCTRDAERALVLRRAAAIRTVETLRFLLPYLDTPYAADACQAVVELAHHRTLREPNKAEFDRALDRVIETSKDATVIDRAGRYKKGQTWAAPAKP